MKYDFVIIGAGSAGSILAIRLRKLPQVYPDILSPIGHTMLPMGDKIPAIRILRFCHYERLAEPEKPQGRQITLR